MFPRTRPISHDVPDVVVSLGGDWLCGTDLIYNRFRRMHRISSTFRVVPARKVKYLRVVWWEKCEIMGK